MKGVFITNWEELFINLIYALVTLVVIPLLSWGIFELKKYIAKKTENQCSQVNIKAAMDIIEKSVIMVSQTYVETLKNEGKFDKQAQLEALSRSFNNAQALITPKTQALITSMFGDFNTWLITIIESKVNETKISAK